MTRATVLLALCAATVLRAADAAAQTARRQAPARRTSTRPLTERLRRLLDEEPFNRALWGVAIADPNGRIVFERNGDRLFVPASNAKLVVSAVAVALLPPSWRFRTSVYAAGPIEAGVLRGDLVLYGRGDPTLSARYFPTRFSAFDELADSLGARGLTRVEGSLVGDASYFDSVTVHPTWETGDLAQGDAAPVAALGFNDNVAEFRIAPGAIGRPPEISFEPDLGVLSFANRARTVPADSPRTVAFFRAPSTNVVWAEGDVPADARPSSWFVAIHDPPAYAAEAFRRSLESRGIHVAGQTRSVYDSTVFAAARRGPPLAEHLSPGLTDIIRPILETSQNWFAEMLLKTLGRELRGRGSWEAGLDVERRFLVDSMRVDSTLFSLADGSGLSRLNLIAPRALLRLLQRLREHPRARPFLESLAVAGTTGTLRLRFRDSALAGRVRAKTGSITNVNTLSGYLERPGAAPWVFAIQINHHLAKNRDALAQIDSIVAALAR